MKISICDKCKERTEHTTEVRVGPKKYEVCNTCKDRLIDWITHAPEKSILERFSKVTGFN